MSDLFICKGCNHHSFLPLPLPLFFIFFFFYFFYYLFLLLLYYALSFHVVHRHRSLSVDVV